MAEERIETSSETEEERHARHEKERERLREKRRKNSMIVSFIMAFVMVIEIATVGIYMGFFSSGSSKRLTGYIETYSGEAYEVTLQRLEALAIKNGLPTSVYEDVITLDRVKITLEAFVNDLADRDFNSEIVTDDLNKAINENARLHLTSTGVKIDENVNDNINSFSEQCVNTYKNTLIFSHFRTIRQLKLYLYYVVIAVSIVCVTIIAICLILLNRFASRKRQMLRYIIYALGASWILIFIPSILIYNRLIPIYLSGMKLEFQFNLIMNYFYNAFHYLITVSYLLFAVYLILVAAWYYVATRKRSHI